MTDENSDKKTDIATPVTTQVPLQPSESPSQLSPSPASPPDLPLSDEEELDSPRSEWFRKYSKLIASISLIALLICLVGHYSSVQIDWTRTKDFADALKNLVEVVAIIVGGGWALFRFSKGRTFKESLIPVVSGKLIVIDKKAYLIVNTQVKNVGQSRIDFAPKASSLKLFEYSSSPSTEIITVTDKKLTQFDALHENDRYIEPNEIIDGTRFIVIPGPLDLGFRLELEIISSLGFTWRASSIVEKSLGGGSITPVELP
jgi:flagellar biogenesis protein FliO